MKNNDVELIRNVLSGDESAFSTLVEKYQKQIHALAWRKIGDFHIAEEITQDTFLKAYQKLASLKQPHRFSGWLYVIATRCCQDRLRKKQIETEPLDEMDSEEVETEAYSRYVAEQEAKVTVEAQRNVVKRLLANLPESERTVITLHYFGEMTCEKMSEFLGVSVNTIKSRLRRARNRLKKEESMIREAISNFKISPILTENIMQEVSQIELAAPSNSKPMIPWIIGVSGALLIVLMLGIGSQYLSRFQRPYSLDAQSEMAVDIVDSPIVRNLEAIPANRNQLGKLADNRGRDNGNENESDQIIGDQGNYSRWKLPEKAKIRLGKGKVSNYEGNLTTIGKGRSYHFTSNSSQFLVMTSVGIWSYDVLTGKELMLSSGSGRVMEYVVLSPDLRTYALTPNHKIELWDVHSDKLITTLEGHDRYVSSVAFSPDGKMLASSDSAGIIRIWEIENGLHRVISTPLNFVSNLMFSPDGNTIVSSSNDDVRLWDTATGKFRFALEETAGVNNIIYNSNGSILFGVYRSEVRFWEPDTGKINLRLKFDRHLNSFDTPLALSPDGKTFAIVGKNDSTVELWDTQTGLLKNTLAEDQENKSIPIKTEGVSKRVDYTTKVVRSIAFSPDGRILAVGSDYEIVLWDHASETQELTLTGKGIFFNLMFSPNGRNIVAQNLVPEDESGIYMWNIDMVEKHNSKLRHFIKDHNREIYSMAFNSDGKTLVSSHDLEEIKFWDVTNGKLKMIGNGYQQPTRILSFAFTPNGKILSTLSRYSPNSYNIPVVLLWNAVTGEYLSSLTGHEEEFRDSHPYGYGGGIAFGSDGKTLVSGSKDGTVRLWNLKTARGKAKGSLSSTLKGHTASVLCIDLSPDGHTIASGSANKTVRLWDVGTRTLKATLVGHTDAILTVAFSPDGLYLASGCNGGSVHLWDPKTGEHKTSLIGNELFKRPVSLPRTKDDPPNITGRTRGAVKSLLFSPDAKTLVVGNAVGTIDFWDMSTLQIKSTYSRHHRLHTIAISPDGHTLASGGLDGTILIWDVQP
ncbi:MAG: sigma-70 family RNA polymerase sigma factor [Candidatus Poribacteria bacterium]|nr:sigma-70 family RNA polymerase sigma factor [Candidatus Poribacteria bacterium]